MPTHPRYSADVSPAAWLRPRLAGWGTVTSVVPAGYPAYARVLHPVDDDVRWAEVAARTGRRVHPLVQWHRLVGAAESINATDADGNSPRTGELEPVSLAAVLRVLRRHTGTPGECWFCLWEGWGWLPGSPSVALLGSREPVPAAFPPDVLDGPRVQLPGRDHLLFTGPLESALAMGHWPRPDWFLPQSPQLAWPADRAWCLGTEIDFDSTLVAGDRALVDELLATDALEVVEVRPGDSLSSGGDTVD